MVMMNGQKHSFNVSFNEKILSLMAFIHSDLGYKVSSQTLYFEGVKMHKHQKFSTFNISNGAIIHLNVDVDGGALGGKRLKTSESIGVFVGRPEVSSTDIPCVADVLSINKVDLIQMISDFPSSDLLVNYSHNLSSIIIVFRFGAIKCFIIIVSGT